MKSTLIMAMATAFLVSFINVACTQDWGGGAGISGDGAKVTKDLTLDNFHSISLSIGGNVKLKQGSTQSVRVEGQENIIENLRKEVKDGVWKIAFTKNVRQHEPLTIWITVPDIKALKVSGSGSIVGEGQFSNLSDLELAISGSGDIAVNANSTSMDIAISGSGEMKLAGTTGDAKIAISGSGDISAFDLQSNSCHVSISGSGDASVDVKQSLEVAIAGSGDVYYEGNPSVKSRISGSGDVISK